MMVTPLSLSLPPSLCSLQILGVDLKKNDEMQSLICGVHYLCGHYTNECYYWENPKDENRAKKVPFQLGPDPYPYIVVNIGSGVSILLVESMDKFKRIGGTSVGGGTFLGLCGLLTGVDSFEGAISLAEKGDSTQVDKLVRDIYGGGYEKFGLDGDVVASRYVWGSYSTHACKILCHHNHITVTCPLSPPF